jgi:hypothetical protein
MKARRLALNDLMSSLMGSSGQVSSADLKRWGYEAANEFLNKQASLDDTILGIARENRLNLDQIHRVAETANHVAFADKFKTASQKVIEYPMADKDLIYDRMSGAAKTKTAAVVVQLRPTVRGSRGVDLVSELVPLVKVAEVYEESRPNGELQDLYFNLNHHAREKRAEAFRARSRVKLAEAEWMRVTKQTLLREDATLHDIDGAIRGLGRGDGFVKKAMTMIIEPFAIHGVLNKRTLGFAKEASRAPNPAHPLAVAYNDLCDSMVQAEAMDDVASQLEDHRGRVKTAMLEACA